MILYNRYLNFFIVTFLLFIINISAQNNKCLRSGEVFDCKCEPDVTCDNLGEELTLSTTMTCIEKCYCVGGYARNSQNVCIPIKQCPSKICLGIHEVYNLCPILFPPEMTCKDLLRPRSNFIDTIDINETRRCVPRCECKSGYIRKTEDGECISKFEC